MIKRIRAFLVSLALAIVPACESEPAADPSLLFISNVSVVDVEAGTVAPDQDVFLREKRIAWVGPAGTSVLPEPGQVVSGEGLFLMPGLWDSHVHVFSAEGEPDFALPLYILHGVTSIRDMGALIPLEAQLDVNAAIESGNRIGPRIINAGAMIDGPPGSWPGQMVAATPKEGRARVHEAATLGWTSVKAYSLLDLDTYRAVAEEAEALGMPLYGHVPEGVMLADAIAAGQDVIEHFGRVTKACSSEEQDMIEGARAALASEDPFPALMAEMATHSFTTFETWDLATCDEAIDALVAAGVAIAPTLMVADFYLGNDPAPDDKRMQTVPLAVRAAWGEPDFRREAMTEDLLAIAPDAVRQDRDTFKRAHEAGVIMLASSDAAFLNPFLFHGATLIDELERYVEIGLTPHDALATATLSPVRLFGEDAETGQVEQGQRADLILLRANPLEDISAIRNLEAVIANGRLFDRAALDDLEATLRSRANADAGE
jgi:imidazolonepropionase-like amidohydrolase